MAIQEAYWNSVGATKTFTHPIDLDWLTTVRHDARVLDYGCGYGRVMSVLAEHGFTDVSGVDVSAALIERGRAAHPELRFDVMERPPATGQADSSIDLVLLFAVLTCVPEDDAQVALIEELRRVLLPGGLLYFSDLLMSNDERNRSRYLEHARATGAPYGVFSTGDGAVVRHHTVEHLREVFGALDLVAERELEVPTMNGNAARGVQLLLRAR